MIEDEKKSLLSWKLFMKQKNESLDFQKANAINTNTFDIKTKLTCRNPFKIDESVINYDLDSEDEWAEENGEDLDDNCAKMSDDDEDDLAEQEAQNGFIVDDDYLSVSEMNFSCASDDEQNSGALLQINL